MFFRKSAYLLLTYKLIDSLHSVWQQHLKNWCVAQVLLSCQQLDDDRILFSHRLVVRCYDFVLHCTDLFPLHLIINCLKSYFRGAWGLCSARSLISGCFQGTDVFLGFWPFGNALCKAVVSIDYYNMFTSTFTLTVMSMDRYVAVCHPVKALDMRTPHKAKVKNASFQRDISEPLLLSGHKAGKHNIQDIQIPYMSGSNIMCIMLQQWLFFT